MLNVDYNNCLTNIEKTPNDGEWLTIGHGAKICVSGFSLEIKIEHCSTVELAYSVSDSKLTILSSNAPEQSAKLALGKKPLASLLQFGCLSPKDTVFCDATRLLPGWTHHFELGKDVFDYTRSPLFLETDIAFISENDAIVRIEDSIDKYLEDFCQKSPPLLMFSGGVDSALIAARLVTLGRTDTVLVNYANSREDPESILAEEMARVLGLAFHRVILSESGLDQALDDFFREPGVSPFCDRSVIPMRILTRYIREHWPENTVVLDGSGADGAFGLVKSARAWRLLSYLPRKLSLAISRLYEYRRYWLTISQVERLMRLISRVGHLPTELAFIAQNPLGGSLFRLSDTIKDDLVSDFIGSLPNTCSSFLDRIIYFDTCFVGARIFAQKAAILNRCGHTIGYPFLTDDILQLGLNKHIQLFSKTEPKSLLKKSLLSCLPHHMVYRPKAAFVMPSRHFFSHPALTNKIRLLLNADPKKFPFANKHKLEELVNHIENDRDIPTQTSNAIWSLLFVYIWINANDVTLQ